MFAVIKVAGKQFKVAVGDSLNIEKLSGDYKVGDKVVFDQVLLVDNGQDTTIGTPVTFDRKGTVRLALGLTSIR